MWYLLLGLYLTIGWFLPWWSFIAIAALGGYLSRGLRDAATSGFFGTAIAWWMICYFLDLRGEGMVSTNLGALFGTKNNFLFILAVGLAAGIAGALAAGCGHYLRRARVSA
jgi:hypothetical protein